MCRLGVLHSALLQRLGTDTRLGQTGALCACAEQHRQLLVQCVGAATGDSGDIVPSSLETGKEISHSSS